MLTPGPDHPITMEPAGRRWRAAFEGHVIAEADIWARRPGSGEIAGYDFDKVVGKRMLRAVVRNTQLRWEDLG